MDPLLIYLLAADLCAFCLMGWDKYQARRGAWRISERALFLSALLGGALGALLGMQLFRHKTKHLRFVIGIPVILLLQVAVLLWAFVLRDGSWRSLLPF